MDSQGIDKNRDQSDNKLGLMGITRFQARKVLERLILLFFFISGLSGLIYEILWTKMIVQVIGGAPFAVSIVLTIFMGGLGLGSYLASRKIDSIFKPSNLIRLYAALELTIGGYALILPLLFGLSKPAFSLVYSHFLDKPLLYHLFTLVGCFILLILPATCLGATLPVLSRFFISTLDTVGTQVGRLYGLNTIGGAAGSLLCGFWLIESLGVSGALSVAVILNLMTGIACLLVSRRFARKRPQKRARASMVAQVNTLFPIHVSGNSWISRRAALVIITISGFCAMGYEVIWTRLLSLVIGPTTYSLTIVLISFIAGLALGSLYFGWLADRTKDLGSLLLVTLLGAPLAALLVSQLLGNSQILFSKLIYHFKDSFGLLSLVEIALLFGLLLLPTFCLGGIFPIVGKVYTRELDTAGRSIGVAYSLNSLGAVLGSFVASFLLITTMGKERSLSLLVAIQLLMALYISGRRLLHVRVSTYSNSIIFFVLAFVGCALAYVYPVWDRELLARGKYHRINREELAEAGWLDSLFTGARQNGEKPSSELVYFGDGIGGFTTVFMHRIDIFGKENVVLYNSGKPDASSHLDRDTQTLLAHFPMMFHERPKSVLVIGLASGMTAGEMLHYPITNLDIVEINEQVVEASDRFLQWNNQVLDDPRTSLILQDGRAHLELSRQRYDVISSEPSNPWMAGLASLFTKEFFSLAKKRLNDNGIFVQMFHAYQMDWNTFAMVGRTFAEVFPNSLLAGTNPISIGPDFLLVGFKGEHSIREEIAAKNLVSSKKSQNVSIQDHRLFYSLIVSENLEQLFGEGFRNSDNRPWLEFAAPRLIHSFDPSIVQRILSKPILSERTVEVLRSTMNDIDYRIDFVEYALPSVDPAIGLESPFDLSKATEAQRQRWAKLTMEYCSENVVYDFSFLGDADLRKDCITAQIEVTTRRLQIAADKGPLQTHLDSLRTLLDQTSDSPSENF